MREKVKASDDAEVDDLLAHRISSLEEIVRAPCDPNVTNALILKEWLCTMLLPMDKMFSWRRELARHPVHLTSINPLTLTTKEYQP